MIAFDFDDVVGDTDSVMMEGIFKRTGHRVPHRNDYYFDLPENMTREEGDKLTYKVLYEDTHLIKPLNNSIFWLSEFYKLTQKPIHILTARPNFLKYPTEKWMREHVNYKFPYFITLCGNVPKIEFLRKDKYFVDDKISTANDVAKTLDKSFLINKPWNENKEILPNVIRVNDLGEVLKHYKLLEKI